MEDVKILCTLLLDLIDNGQSLQLYYEQVEDGYNAGDFIKSLIEQNKNDISDAIWSMSQTTKALLNE